MKIRKNIDLTQLEKFGYRYQENLIFPTYRKVVQSGKKKTIIEILVLDRTIFINRRKVHSADNFLLIRDLKLADFLE